jgi:hypothetical protein
MQALIAHTRTKKFTSCFDLMTSSPPLRTQASRQEQHPLSPVAPAAHLPPPPRYCTHGARTFKERVSIFLKGFVCVWGCLKEQVGPGSYLCSRCNNSPLCEAATSRKRCWWRAAAQLLALPPLRAHQYGCELAAAKCRERKRASRRADP